MGDRFVKIKDWVFIILFTYLVISITSLFYINLAKGEPLTLDTINDWVSLILGLVATIFSVLSMWLSFHSLDKSNERNEESIRNMNSLKEEILKRVDETNAAYLQHFNDLKGKIDVTNTHLDNIKEHVIQPKLNVEKKSTSKPSFEYDDEEWLD